ncbi:unnamed protein product [Amoebophrya sp. A25]|nr:unnamed protein product [Amoebophrya sp. A25]|eukprot:GSA25T00013900001.1
MSSSVTPPSSSGGLMPLLRAQPPWLIGSTVALVLGCIILDVDKHLVPPRDAPFYENDARLGHPVRHDTVPAWFVIVFAYSAYLPIALTAAMGAVASRGHNLRYWGSYDRPKGAQPCPTLLYYIFAVALVHFLTSVSKIYVGRKRPNFFAICEYDFNASPKVPAFPGSSLIPANVKYCRRDPVGAMLSFPSGHSSLSWVSSTWLALELNARPLAQCGFLLFASFVACSRVVDFRHHPEDIIAGSVLGGLGAFMVHRQMIRAHFVLESGLVSPLTGTPPGGKRSAQLAE